MKSILINASLPPPNYIMICMAVCFTVGQVCSGTTIEMTTPERGITSALDLSTLGTSGIRTSTTFLPRGTGCTRASGTE